MARADSPQARFLATGTAYIAFARENPEFFRAMFGPDAVRGTDGAYALLVDTLRELEVAGPVEDAALTAWSAVHGLAVLLVDRATAPADVDAAVAHLTRTVLRGLGGPPTTPGRPR